MLRVIFINFLVLIPLIFADPGRCPRITGLPLDPQRAVGRWYIYKRSFSADDVKLHCGQVLWDQPIGRNFTMNFSGISRITNANNSVVVEGNADSHTFRHHVPVLGEVDVNNYVLGAVYNRWGLLWQCEDYGDTHIEKSYVLTREKYPISGIESFIENSFRRWGLKRPGLVMVDQSC